MGQSVIQPSFANGELDEAFHGHVDLARYQISLKTCRNFVPRISGGVRNRSGTVLVCEAKAHTYAPKRIKFSFNTEQEYILEFYDNAMRVVKDGGLVVYSSGAQAGQVFELATPYTAAAMHKATWTQLNDVMTLCVPGYQTRQLNRAGHDNWTLTSYEPKDGPFQDTNVDKGKTIQASAETGSGVTLTAVGHAPFTAQHVGMLVYLEQQDFGKPWEVAVNVNTGDVRRSEGKYYEAQNGDGTGSLRPTQEADIWDDGSVKWKYLHSGWGVAKITGFTSSTVVTAEIASRIPKDCVTGPTYRWAFGAWGGDQGWPRAVTYHKQRKAFAASPTDQGRLWFSAVNSFTTYSKSSPTKDDDPFRAVLASAQANGVRHLVSFGDSLLVLTTGAEWAIRGNNENGALTPSARQAEPVSYYGTAEIPPLLVNSNLLWITRDGQSIRDLAANNISLSFDGADLSLLAKHLTRGKKVVAWAHQAAPDSVVWIAFSDGTLASMTYFKEQQMLAWARHDTALGAVDDVNVLIEGDEYAVYWGTRRTIGGVTKRYLERMVTRDFSDLRDAHFVDCGLVYDGRNKGAATLQIIGGAAWTAGERMSLQASAPTFSTNSVGNEYHFTLSDGRALRFAVDQFVTPQLVNGTTTATVPASLRNTAVATWAHARKVFGGLMHLDGATVAALADGNKHPPMVVSHGVCELQYCASVVHIGLPITADFQTLDLAAGGGVRDKKKNIPVLRLLVKESRGLLAGPDADNLYEYKQTEFGAEDLDQPQRAASGLIEIGIKNTWNSRGSVFVRQSDPLPLWITAAIPDVNVSGA